MNLQTVVAIVETIGSLHENPNEFLDESGEYKRSSKPAVSLVEFLLSFCSDILALHAEPIGDPQALEIQGGLAASAIISEIDGVQAILEQFIFAIDSWLNDGDSDTITEADVTPVKAPITSNGIKFSSVDEIPIAKGTTTKSGAVFDLAEVWDVTATAYRKYAIIMKKEKPPAWHGKTIKEMSEAEYAQYKGQTDPTLHSTKSSSKSFVQVGRLKPSIIKEKLLNAGK